ncbi:MAG: type III secretion system export apparatus subunit SctR [Janthinobacterium lividum]
MYSIPPLYLILILSSVSLLPLAVVVTTCFTKISCVLLLTRNALGVQQAPPNMAIYALSLVLSLYVMAPVWHHAYAVLAGAPDLFDSFDRFVGQVARAVEPLRAFLHGNTRPSDIDFFVATARSIWPKELADTVSGQDFLVLIPAFMVSELTAAFEVGFLIGLPFIVIDLVVQSILLALGMMMMSPVTISLPLKLLLFTLVEGWTKLISSMVLSYSVN